MRFRLLTILLLAAAALPAPAAAQTAGELDLRVNKLEKEMKAIQRTVFPNGAPLTPEIGANPIPQPPAGDAATSPVADLTARIDALEKGLAAVTGQVESQGNRLRLVEEAVKAQQAPSPQASAPVDPAIRPTSSPAPIAPRAEETAAPKSDSARRAAVAAVEIPSTGDAGEDAYTYGYRLYSAGLYPEAEAKLKEVVAKYPKHRRASYAQNLLGRSYFDEGKPALASVAFYDNYQKMPKGDRASESLYWLGRSLTRLNKLPDACKVYDEWRDVYGAAASAELKAKVTKGRADAKCSA